MARKAKIKTTKSGVTDSTSLNKEVRQIVPKELEFAPPVPPPPGILFFPPVQIEFDKNAYRAIMRALEESVEDDLEIGVVTGSDFLGKKVEVFSVVPDLFWGCGFEFL